MKRKQNILILEGPDGVGKTTIGKELARQTGIPYFRHEGDHDYWRRGVLKQHIEFSQPYFVQFLEQTGHSVIVDRAYTSEWVYSSVYGRETCSEVLEDVDARMASLGAVILLFLRRNYAFNKDDELVTADKLEKLHDGYLKLRRWTRCAVITMHTDFFGDNLERQLPQLHKYLPDIEQGERINLG